SHATIRVLSGPTIPGAVGECRETRRGPVHLAPSMSQRRSRKPTPPCLPALRQTKDESCWWSGPETGSFPVDATARSSAGTRCTDSLHPCRQSGSLRQRESPPLERRSPTVAHSALRPLRSMPPEAAALPAETSPL